MSAGTSGAVNVGLAALEELRVTVGPPVCVHAWTRDDSSGSVLAPPLSVTVAPSATVWSEPAFAVGAAFASPRTVTFTASAAES